MDYASLQRRLHIKVPLSRAVVHLAHNNCRFNVRTTSTFGQFTRGLWL